MNEASKHNKWTRQVIAIMSFLTFIAILIPYMFRMYEAPDNFLVLLGIVNTPWLWFYVSREKEKASK